MGSSKNNLCLFDISKISTIIDKYYTCTVNKEIKTYRHIYDIKSQTPMIWLDNMVDE